MDRTLQPVTEPGRRFVALCEDHAADFATRADEHDRDGTFPYENVTAMQESGAAAACVPEELGGLGVTSLRDLAAGVNRLGRGDGSTAIAIQMHLSSTAVSARIWRAAVARGEAGPVEGIAAMLAAVGAGSLISCVLGTEPGSMSFHPQTELTAVDGGYRLNGRKTFGTLSPVADLMLTVARLRRDDEDLLAFATISPQAEGVELHDNWDALGMRASGSQDIVFTDVFVPDALVFGEGPWGGQTVPGMTGQVTGNSGLIGAFLGIAEAAHEHAVDLVQTRRKTPSSGPLAERAAIQHLAAENEIDLASARATLERAMAFADSVFDDAGRAAPTLADMHQVMAETQMAKLFVEQRAIDVADRALTMSGGSGYLSSSPLSRYYRDVRAGPFMQQYSPVEAYEYIGKVALGLDPKLDL